MVSIERFVWKVRLEVSLWGFALGFCFEVSCLESSFRRYARKIRLENSLGSFAWMFETILLKGSCNLPEKACKLQNILIKQTMQGVDLCGFRRQELALIECSGVLQNDSKCSKWFRVLEMIRNFWNALKWRRHKYLEHVPSPCLCSEHWSVSAWYSWRARCWRLASEFCS